ncbi:hypothetical protein ACG92Y_02035 [Acinetobacter ursingii]|uniref:hypothetical protein n=2 Tax=Acinetobacter TaxID=469 RepID=UPI003AF9D89C
MSNTVFVPKLKHQKLLDQAIHEDQKFKRKEFEEHLKSAESYFNQHRWWLIANEQMIFDRTTGLLWENLKSSIVFNLDAARSYSDNKQIASLAHWKLPSKGQVQNILDADFPLKSGGEHRINSIRTLNLNNSQMWLDRDYPSETNNQDALTLICNDFISQKKNILDILIACLEKNWTIKPYHDSNSNDFKIFKDNAENILQYKKFYECSTPQFEISQIWKDVDYISTRLPKIESLRFTDIDQGIWEFYAPKFLLKDSYQKIESESFVRARNPELDIRDAKVAIDFGTSSTVVAIRSNGQDELLRIGLQEKDFKKHILSDNDFENPTVLEFLDIQEFLKAWESEAYRPLVDWNTIHCSHEARTRVRENDSDPKIVSSIFARLKQWALRDAEQARVRITDQKNHEYEFKTLTELNPIKGQALSIQNYPQLDPIELYAWFLGMNINWRERGIYLKYYMTFPVAYPNEVKEKILSSFRRGLQRSLPESLIYSERFNDFAVQELASEPAAFAASALDALEILPTEEGVAYAVFDFGGGTTDFDYGIYRLADSQEFDEGWDHVIEHFGSSGDRFLGGENLLENLAYQVFKYNHEMCRDKEISFTKPIDAQSFVASERLIAQTQAAYTNTTLLMSKLRPLWESGAVNQDSDGVLQLTLLNRHGSRVECEVKIPEKLLIEWLQNRIKDGLKNFFTSLKASFENQLKVLPEEIHILLAGNSSRSRIVLGLLGCLEDDESQILHELLLNERGEIFSQDECPNFDIHLPLQADDKNPYAPTTKTGVALGLLRVSPGETLKVINHAQEHNTDSPFQYFVGTHRRDIFSAALKRGDTYGEWIELGPIRAGVFPLLYTTQSQALNGIKRGTNGLVEKNIEFSGTDAHGKKVFAKIISPDSIELGLALNIEQIEEITNRRTVVLKI